MKLIFRESPHINYSLYQFPYMVYAIKEPNDDYNTIYDKGFLPYSNDLSIEEEIYYLARSIRIDLTQKIFSYKQNNVFHNFENIYPESQTHIELVDKEVLIQDKTFLDWCIKNAKNQFLTKERLQYILSRTYLKKILLLYADKELLAYIFVISDAQMLHLWYSFYNLEKGYNNMGKWVILNIIKWCKSKGYRYFYIGTCYSQNAFYKLTLSPRTEYFTGETWCKDISSLKKRLLAGEI